jgi:predicted ArsR family transcriptional regulator
MRLRASALQLGTTQQALLRQLLWHPEGLGVEQLCDKLRVSHNAVRQHLTALGSANLIERAAPRPSGGRPGAIFAITELGRELFPRQYGHIASGLIEKLYATLGREQVMQILRALGTQLAGEQPEPVDRDDVELASRQLAGRLTALGYEAAAIKHEGQSQIEAHNCVFHSLAARHPEVCHFDLAFLSASSGREVRHAECMVRGGRVCRFALGPRTDAAKDVSPK